MFLVFFRCLVLVAGLWFGAANAQELQEIARLSKAGQYALALEKVNSYLATQPKDPTARFLKAVILTEQGKSNEAIQLFQALTEEYPELPEPYNNLAVLYAQKGQYDKAKTALETSIQTHPAYATAHENLGDVYAKMASLAYDKALQLDKANITAKTKLALIRELFSAQSSPQAVNAKPTVSAQVKPVEPAATQAAVPSTAIQPKPLAVDENKIILTTLQNWATAWSSRDVDRYLAFYAKDFRPDGESYATWLKSRRERLAAPKSIEVKIEQANVAQLDTNRATVAFRQHYTSDTRRVVSNKTLTLHKQDGAWLIVKESGR